MTDAIAKLTRALAERYSIERELGEGGMATVYLANDLRHGRRVAIKVLRPELAAVIGAERFVREIRTIATLQHPHILGLIDSGEVDGTAYFVMPYVSGESLRDRLDRETQLAVSDAVRIAIEVASALDYAHRNGVIHRDIKPANILLHDGSALVADFGISLAATGAAGTRMTETGMSLGTPHYMSPEQAMGEREITRRSDVYALGAVLYEMLTGEPPFTGPTAQAIVAKVVTEEPRRLAPKRHTIPPNVEAAVLTALEKLAADRFASAADFAAALSDPSYRGAGAGVAGAGAHAVPHTERSGRSYLPLAAAGLAGVLLGAGALAAVRGAPEPPPVSRYGLALPEGQQPTVPAQALPSPDGSKLAFLLPLPGDLAVPQIWIKERDRYEAEPLTAAQGAYIFAWSPDSRSLAFALRGQLRRAPAGGGAAVTLADSVSGNPGLAWLEDDTIVFITGEGNALAVVDAAGGPARRVHSDSAEVFWPAEIEGSRAVLFTRCSNSCETAQAVWALDLESGEAHPVLEGAARAWYTPTGHLVYVRPDGSVLAAPFSRGDLAITGPAVPLFDSVLVVNRVAPIMGVSRSGTVALRRGSPMTFAVEYEMVWVDRAGVETPVDSGWTVQLTVFGENYGWALSPDGRRLAIGLATSEGDDIWVKQLPRGPLSRVSYAAASEYRPRWMPDGRVMFGSNRRGSGPDSVGAGGLYARRADGTGADSLILRAQQGVYEGQWSPDGRWLVFRTGGTVGLRGGRDIVGIRPGVDTAPVPVVATPYDEEAIAISPDGRWLAYESNETGRTEVFLRPFPDTDAGKWQISNGGGYGPLWARDGRELFYMSQDRDMVAVTIGGTGREPEIGERTALFRIREPLYMTRNEFYTPHDVAPDGRFLMARQLAPHREQVTNAPLIVVENWFTELRERMGE